MLAITGFSWGPMMESQIKVAGLSAGIPKNGTPLILSVDDEPTILYTRELLLKHAGYNVLSAINGEEALRLLVANAVDLVLLDYVMPGLDGGVVARAMKQARPHVPVIIVSAALVPEETLPCIDCFLAKGNGPAALLGKVGELLLQHPKLA